MMVIEYGCFTYLYYAPSPATGTGTNVGDGQNNQTKPDKKKKCKQDEKGGDANAILDAQKKAGIADKIQGQVQSPNSPEGLVGYTTDRNALLAPLASNNAFLYNTGMGGLHAKDVGKQNVDSRSRIWSGQGLGRDSRGMRSSLQVVVGSNPLPGTNRYPVYSDLDCVNPAEGALPFLLHAIPIVLKRIGRVFGF